MRRSFDTSGFSLVELLVALGIGAVLVGGAGYYFTNVNRTQQRGDRLADSRSDVLRAAALAQTLFTRRNVTLDVDSSPATKSHEVTTGANSELVIYARPNSTATTNVVYRFRNVCNPAPSGAPPLPAGATGSCGFSCPAGKAPSVELVSSGTNRALVAADSRLRPGGLASAALCVVDQAKGPAAPPLVSFEIVARTYGPDGKSIGGEIAAVELLNRTVRDQGVEFTGRD